MKNVKEINPKIEQTLNCPEDRRVCLNVVAGVVVFFLFVENFAPDPRNDEFAQVFVVMQLFFTYQSYSVKQRMHQCFAQRRQTANGDVVGMKGN